MNAARACLASIVPLVAGLAHAQEMSWHLPERGAALFARTFDMTSEVLDTSEDPPPGKNPSLHLFDWRQENPPVLFQGELDRKQQGRAQPPHDLRELMSFVALDLQRAEKGGKLQYVVPRLLPFGDIVMTGKALPPDGSSQEIELKVKRVPPDPLGEQRIVFQDQIGQHCNHELDGTIKITRRLDRQGGVVAGFEGTFAATVGYPPSEARHTARFAIQESWKLAKIYQRGPEFRADVMNAIRKGTDWLERRIADPKGGNLADGRNGDGLTYNSGRLALGLLALIKAEVDRNKTVVTSGLAELRRREITDTYSLAMAIMALEAYYAPIGERDQMIRGALKRPGPRQLSAADKECMREWVERLLRNGDTRARDSVRRWNYIAAPRFDNSNTQYALLGLWSAHLCGVTVPDDVWIAAANHWLKTQASMKDTWLDLQLVSQRELAHLEESAEKRATVARRRLQPAGWGYNDDGHPPYGSMTAAGITGLTLCEAVLKERHAAAGLLARIELGIRSAFAWFGAQFTMRCNTGFAPQWHNRRYYYFYGIERACELSQVALLQDRDWYFEGATMLMAWQNAGGDFGGDVQTETGDLENSAFAILFLKKAVLPVFTGSR